MSLARDYSRILRRQVRMHAAWMPLVSEFSLGDYGLWRRGVFTPVGNIKEYGVDIRTCAGREVSLDFVSSGGRMISMVGKSQVSVLPDSDEDAELRLEFSKKSSFALKAASLRSTRIDNVAEIARALNAARKRGGAGRWRLRYKVIFELFSGEDVTLLATVERNTAISLHGTASALRGFQSGKGISGSVDVGADKRLGLNVVGGQGVIGFGLFRARVSGIPAMTFGDEPLPPEQVIDEQAGELFELASEEAGEDDPADDPEDDAGEDGAV